MHTNPHNDSPQTTDIFSDVGTNLLSTLRASTIELYENFSQSVLADASVVTRENYVRHLKQFYIASSNCLACIDWEKLEQLGLSYCIDRKNRYQNIVNDLEALGENVPDQALYTPECDQLNLTAETSIGYIFVLEGNTHIARDMAAAFIRGNVGIGHKETTYLRGYGAHTYKRWGELVNWLDEIEVDEDFKRKSCEEARKAFNILSTALTPEK